MEMRLKKGAIVSFGMKNQFLAPASCKVIDVTETDVVVVEQAYVSRMEFESGTGVKMQDLNHRISVDFGSPVRLPRAQIREWHYSVVPNDTHMYYSAYRPSDVRKMPRERINCYDDDGNCKGDGDYLE